MYYLPNFERENNIHIPDPGLVFLNIKNEIQERTGFVYLPEFNGGGQFIFYDLAPRAVKKGNMIYVKYPLDMSHSYPYSVEEYEKWRKDNYCIEL